jgi:hypothetical protein
MQNFYRHGETLINYFTRTNHASIGVAISDWFGQLANRRNTRGHHHD